MNKFCNLYKAKVEFFRSNDLDVPGAKCPDNNTSCCLRGPENGIITNGYYVIVKGKPVIKMVSY